jgi:hypothetical protein
MKYVAMKLGNFLKIALWRTIQDLGTSDTILKPAFTGMASFITAPLTVITVSHHHQNSLGPFNILSNFPKKGS